MIETNTHRKFLPRLKNFVDDDDDGGKLKSTNRKIVEIFS